MIGIRSLSMIVLLSLIINISAGAIEEDWSKYIRTDEDTRDGKGQDITLTSLRKTFENADANYTITVKDFDAGGGVVLVITFRGRNETYLLSGTWNENRTKIILPDRIQAFDKTMNITTLKITPPAGVFTCCPEVQIKVDLIRPELFLEFNEGNETTNTYYVVDPYANWDISVDRDSPYKSPFDDKRVSDKNVTKDTHDAYRKNDEIPMDIKVTNYGDEAAEGIVLYIDSDELIFEEGEPYTNLPMLGGQKQVGFKGETELTTRFIFKFPPVPEKLNYTVHAYIKGEKNNNIYYYDDTKEIKLLPSIGIQKSVTKESLLMDRKEVEYVYPVYSEQISRWLQSKDIFVNIGVSNYENYGINNISLHDTLHSQFIAENQSLNWTFDLKPMETREFSYKIETNRPGTYSLPAALLTYKDLNLTWNLVSTGPSIEVHGSCIQIYKKPEKTTVIAGNNTNITVNIVNTGDMPSKVVVNDSLPVNSSLFEGKIYYEGVIPPRETVSFSYNISMGYEGEVELPNPVLFVNGKRSSVCGQLITSRIYVRKYFPPSIPRTPIPTRTIMTPIETQNPEEIKNKLLLEYNWLEGVLPAFMLVLAVAVLYTLYRKNI